MDRCVRASYLSKFLLTSPLDVSCTFTTSFSKVSYNLQSSTLCSDCEGEAPPAAFDPDNPALAVSTYIVTAQVPGTGATGTVGFIGKARGGPRVEMRVNPDMPFMFKHEHGMSNAHELFLTVDGQPLHMRGTSEMQPTSVELPGLLIYHEPSSMTVTFIFDAGARAQVRRHAGVRIRQVTSLKVTKIQLENPEMTSRLLRHPQEFFLKPPAPVEGLQSNLLSTLAFII